MIELVMTSSTTPPVMVSKLLPLVKHCLSSLYFTYEARSGISTDADRNCISNIHQNGLGYGQALKKLLYLINGSEKLLLSGINLKDETTDVALDGHRQQTNFLLD